MAGTAPLQGGVWFNYLCNHYPEMAQAVRTFYTEYYREYIATISDDDVSFCLLNYFNWVLRRLYGVHTILTPEDREMFEIALNNSDFVYSELTSVFFVI